eukprot:452549-Amphidinium_carterae.1
MTPSLFEKNATTQTQTFRIQKYWSGASYWQWLLVLSLACAGVPKSVLAVLVEVYLYRDSVLYSQYFKGKNTNYILEVIRKLVDFVYLHGAQLQVQNKPADCGPICGTKRGHWMMSNPIGTNKPLSARIVKKRCSFLSEPFIGSSQTKHVNRETADVRSMKPLEHNVSIEITSWGF